jgi:hypothetical protein
MMTPENAIPGSFRFVNFSVPTADRKVLHVRHPFRVGDVSQLDKPVSQHLNTMLRVRQSNPQKIIVSVGLRDHEGRWSFSLIDTATPKGEIRFEQPIAELTKKIPGRGQISKDHYPDLFLFIAGKKIHSASESLFLKAIANNPKVGINSVSTVLVNGMPQGPMSYSIHSLAVPNGAERTPMADFLVATYNHEKSLRQYIQKKTAGLNPFDPE